MQSQRKGGPTWKSVRRKLTISVKFKVSLKERCEQKRKTLLNTKRGERDKRKANPGTKSEELLAEMNVRKRIQVFGGWLAVNTIWKRTKQKWINGREERKGKEGRKVNEEALKSGGNEQPSMTMVRPNKTNKWRCGERLTFRNDNGAKQADALWLSKHRPAHYTRQSVRDAVNCLKASCLMNLFAKTSRSTKKRASGKGEKR